MMRFLAVCCLVASVTSVASAEGIGLFEIVRHEVNGGGTAQLFDGGPPVSEFISGDFPDSLHLGFSVSDRTGVGAGNSSTGAGGFSRISDTSGTEGGRFRLITDLSARYLGDGPNRPGGTVEAELNSIVEFVMPVARVEWEFIFTQREALGFTQESMLTVENVTTGEVLVDTVEPLVFLSELTADIGDVIRVSSSYTASGTAAPEISGFFNSGATLRMTLRIPEPATGGILLFGTLYCSFVYRRRSP